MRWLIIQSDGVHKGQDGWSPNAFLRECYGLQWALRANNEEADIWGLRHENFESPPDFNSYDFILLLENYETSWLPDFSRMSRALRLQWIIDLHCFQDWNFFSRISQDMDIVLHSTRPFIPDYQELAPKCRHLWFPNAVDDRYFRLDESKPERFSDILFIGGKGPARAALLDRMVSETGMTYGYGMTGTQYIIALQTAKIGFNKNQAKDINYRTFEVIACGGCLLTDRDPALGDLGFIHNGNCVLYESADEAVALARKLLIDGSWKTIAEAGHQLSAKHTYTQRIKDLLRQIS